MKFVFLFRTVAGSQQCSMKIYGHQLTQVSPRCWLLAQEAVNWPRRESAANWNWVSTAEESLASRELRHSMGGIWWIVIAKIYLVNSNCGFYL